mmetsp:Transcript_31791/g.68011  ORF Transcript_31791/g.68011 Transcript_31791/m.68011 type:complete len:547 (-) Transcript_31791:154-1794(-)
MMKFASRLSSLYHGRSSGLARSWPSLSSRFVVAASSASCVPVPLSSSPPWNCSIIYGDGSTSTRLRFLSSQPDYTNYETWHKSNYEQPSNSHSLPSIHGHPHQQTSRDLHADLPRTSVLMELSDRVGALHDVLKYYWKYDVNITRIESRPVVYNRDSAAGGQSRPKFDFFVDFHGKVGDPNVNALLKELKGMTDKLLVLDEKEVHWFPRHISELDLIANRTLDAGIDLEADHPGFHDQAYRQRRSKLAESAQKHRVHDEIPTTEYTADETETWGLVWDTMESLWQKYACKEYLSSMNLMKKHCGYSRDTIPQLSTISSFLKLQTDVRLRPVAGLISSRDFLNGLAFRTFFCTQYIRHPSKPLYTPEPDVCHELLGHVPMFADRDFADFSQEIGLASLGASDEDILKLARCYWHSVEFGLCREGGKNKAYGAGLLSSFGELEYSCKERTEIEIHEQVGKIDGDGMPLCPEIKPWDPAVAAMQDFPITTYQPVYFLAESLQDAKLKMRRYCEMLPRPFFALYNAQTETVHIDRPVRRSMGVPEASPAG